MKRLQKFQKLLVSATVKCGTQLVSIKSGFPKDIKPDKIILQLESHFQLSVYITFTELWKVIALEQEMYGTILHDIQVEFSLIINGDTEKSLHKLDIIKGSVAEIQEQLDETSRLATLLFYKTMPLLFEAYTL